jgi:hypothetical protein
MLEVKPSKDKNTRGISSLASDTSSSICYFCLDSKAFGTITNSSPADFPINTSDCSPVSHHHHQNYPLFTILILEFCVSVVKIFSVVSYKLIDHLPCYGQHTESLVLIYALVNTFTSPNYGLVPTLASRTV